MQGAAARSRVSTTGPSVMFRVKVTVPVLGTSALGGRSTGRAGSPPGWYSQVTPLPVPVAALLGAPWLGAAWLAAVLPGAAADELGISAGSPGNGALAQPATSAKPANAPSTDIAIRLRRMRLPPFRSMRG